MSVRHLLEDGRPLCGRGQSDEPPKRVCRECEARKAGTGRYRARTEARKKAAKFVADAKKKNLGGRALRTAIQKLLGPAQGAAPGRAILLEELRAEGFSVRAPPDLRQLEIFASESQAGARAS